MITGSQNGPLNHAFQTVIADNRRRQQLAGQVASGSSYGTMIPTPGMAQSANVNSAASHLMDTRFTGGNSNTGANNFSWLIFGYIRYSFFVQQVVFLS
jgi:E1A/CREB-binding protein